MNDGWNEVEYLNSVLGEIEELKYEVDNCRKGAYTGCRTYEELAEHIRSLGRKLIEAADDVEYQEEDPDEDEGYEDEDFS